jgi:glycosyltransferase
MTLTLVELQSQHAKEVTVTRESYGNRIAIPAVSPLLQVGKANRYARNAVYLLKKYIPDDKENLFHLNYMGNEYLAIELKKWFRGKILLTVHYTDWSFVLWGDKIQLRKILKSENEEIGEPDAESIKKSIEKDRKIIEFCDKIICIAQHSYNDVKEIYHADESKLTLIYNGLEDSCRKRSQNRILHLKKQYYIYTDEKIILYAGRLDEVKGVSFLIRAFRILLQSYNNIRLIIAGDGIYKQLFQDAKDVWAKVTFTGYIPKAALCNLYQIADMGVVCSIHEEFGLVAVEMMVHELPIIVTDTGGLSEIIEDWETGLKVPVTIIKKKRQPDTAALCDRMKWILEHPTEAKQLGKKARARFLKTYELSVWREKMLNIYRKL